MASDIGKALGDYYSDILDEFGPTSRGMDWSDEVEHFIRLDQMLKLTRYCREDQGISLLDVGCGVGFLADRIELRSDASKFQYVGVDISENMINAAKIRRPDLEFHQRDVLDFLRSERTFDLAVLNGVVTEKLDASHSEMEAYVKGMLLDVFRNVGIGLAFNVMRPFGTEQVAKFFHWSLDACIQFIVEEISPHFVIHGEYGNDQEYTVFILREPIRAHH